MEENQLAQAMGVEIQPEVAPEPQVIPDIPQVDPREMQARMEELYRNQQYMAQQLAEARRVPEVQKQLSPDEEVAADVRKKLGLDSLQDEIKAIKAYNEQMAQERAQVQQNAYVGNLVNKYGEQTIQSVEAELRQLSRVNPTLAQSLNTPEGVEYLLSKHNPIAVAQRQPDPVIQSGSNALPQAQNNSIANILNGSRTDDDLFSAFSSHFK